MGERVVDARIRPAVSPDAVVIVPGIMGSKLEDDRGTIWGADDLPWYARVWTRKTTELPRLGLDEAEQRGEYGRVRATGLLKLPAWAPILRGFDPYTDLRKGIDQVVIHRDAVLEFAYDWRLPVEYNGVLLQQAAAAHLARWRQHPEYLRYRAELPDARAAALVLVAHSMGGMVVRAMPDPVDVRATITLGTPLDGAAQAALILNTGEGGPFPLPRVQLQQVGATMPGLYDLLPKYRCLEVPDPAQDPVRLTPDHVHLIGGRADLARAAIAAYERFRDRPLPGTHHALVGIEQPTPTTLSLNGNRVTGHPYTFEPTADGLARDRNGVLVRVLRHGDGTVPDNSSRPTDATPMALAQQHGPIAKSAESIRMVQNVLRQGELGPRLGESVFGFDVPDVVTVGEPVSVALNGIDGPGDVSVVLYDQDNRVVDEPGVRYDPEHERFQVTLEFAEAGIHQLEVSGGGQTAITQRCLAMQV